LETTWATDEIRRNFDIPAARKIKPNINGTTARITNLTVNIYAAPFQVPAVSRQGRNSTALA